MNVTRYQSLLNTIPVSTRTYTWEELVTLFSTFTETTDKFAVGGFGAHTLRSDRIGRRADNVMSVTLAVFDVDAGTAEQVGECERLLRDANQAAHFYSSHSHTKDKPAFRLVIPVTRAMSAAEYPSIRAYLIERFQIPCKPEQSADVSRFWFLPSHKPGATPITETIPGEPFVVSSVPISPFPARSKLSPRLAYRFPPEPPPGTPVDLTKAREAIAARAHNLVRHEDERDKVRGRALRALLKGEVLAEDGERENMTMRVCGMIAYALPRDTPLSTFLLLIRPSLTAMQAAGSKITEEKIERQLFSALSKRAQSDEDRASIHAAFKKHQQDLEAFLTAHKSVDEDGYTHE